MPTYTHPALVLANAHSAQQFQPPHPGTLVAAYSGTHEPTGTSHRVELHHGVLTVNGRRITKPQFTKDGVRWSEKTASIYSAGSLHVMGAGAMLSGFVATGASEHEATVAHVSLDPDAIDFTTEICRNPATTPQVWQSGPPITIGVHLPGDGQLPYAAASIDGEDITVAVLPPSGDAPTVSLSVSVEEWQTSTFDGKGYTLPQTSTITIGFDGNSFSGTMTAYGAPAGATYAWRGQAANAMRAVAAAASPILAAAVSPMAAAAPLQQVELSLIDLMSQSTAGAADIAKQRFQDFTVYAMSDDWRDKLFSIPKPNLDAMERAALNATTALFTDTVCDAFITQQLSNLTKEQGGPSDPISDADKDKLNYFWKRKLAKIKGYEDVSNRLTQIAWESVNPRVKTYADDASTQWGKKLYEALTANHALTQQVLAFISSGYSLTQVNRNAELLVALSPTATETLPGKQGTCTLATLYHYRFISKLAEKLNTRVQLGAGDTQQALAAFIPGWIASLRASIADNVKDPNSKLEPGQRAMLVDMDNAIEMAQRQAGNSVALANQLAGEIASQAGTNLFGKIQNWTKTSKFAKGATKAIALAAFAWGLQSVIGSFKNWGSLTDAAKAQTVIATGELAVDLLNFLADAPLEQLVAKFVNVSDTFDGLGEAIGESLAQDLNLDEDLFSTSMRWMEPELAAGAEGEASTFAKLFGTGSKFMQGFAVITAAAAVGFSAYKVYEDFNGKSTDADKVIDILVLTSNAVVLASAIAAATIGECMLAAAGPFGVVAGAILMIVMMFLPAPEPDRPSDDYMNDRGKNFLATKLDTPPKDWDKPPSTAPALGKAA
jgi:hypothetical protein